MNTQEIIESLRELAAMPDYAPVREMRAAADRLEELQRLNDSMQADRDLWIKVGREKLEAVEKKLTESTNHYNAIIIELARERDETCAEVERLKQALHDARLENSGQAAQLERTRPEPSRLEIAAMAMQGLLAHSAYVDNKAAVEYADALIAAAREAK